MATRSPISSQWAIIAELDGLDGLEVDRALLVGAHQVGDADHRDLVDGLEAAEAGAVGDVADVVVGGRARRRRGGRRRGAASVTLPGAGSLDGARRPTSSMRISLDCCVDRSSTTFCLPRLVVTPVELLDDLAAAA